MEILRSEPPELCAADSAAEFATAPEVDEVTPFATFGIDAASRPVPVAARNARRSTPNDLREFFMRSPHTSVDNPFAGRHYTTLFAEASYVIRRGLRALSCGIEVGTVSTRSGGRFFCWMACTNISIA